MKVTSTLVPFMGIVYILISLLVVVLNIGQLPSVMAQIFEEAFDFKAIFAGFAGSAMMHSGKTAPQSYYQKLMEHYTEQTEMKSPYSGILIYWLNKHIHMK